MKKDFGLFIDHWYQIAIIWSQIALGLALVFIFYYLLLSTTKGTLVKKHQFISSHEIRYFWYVSISLVFSLTIFLNAQLVRVSTGSELVLAIKTLVSIGLGFMIGYVIHIYLHVYYPARLEKRLSALRFKPRVNPTTGKEMRLLTEDEEDVHLTKDMIEHEIASSYEYDVWLDEETGFKIIETYEGTLHMLICEHCDYRTSKEYKHDLVKEPTGTEPGKMVKYYKCSYCDHQQTKESTIPPLSGHYSS